MQPLVVAVFLSIALGLAHAQGYCNAGIVLAQFQPGSTIVVFATNNSDYVIGFPNCLNPNITLRYNFSVTFTISSPLGANAFGIYNASNKLIAVANNNASTGSITWTPSINDLQAGFFYYRSFASPKMTGFIFILPNANINNPAENVVGNVYGSSPSCTSGGIVVPFNVIRFCDPVQNAYVVQCENATGSGYIPVSYACNNCTLSGSALICDELSPTQWPANNTCVPNSISTSGLFYCPKPTAAAPGTPVPSNTGNASSNVPSNAASNVPSNAASNAASVAPAPSPALVPSPVATVIAPLPSPAVVTSPPAVSPKASPKASATSTTTTTASSSTIALSAAALVAALLAL